MRLMAGLIDRPEGPVELIPERVQTLLEGEDFLVGHDRE